MLSLREEQLAGILPRQLVTSSPCQLVNSSPRQLNMHYFHTIFLIVYIGTTLAVMTKVLMDHRQPAKTMAWLLVLTFVPIVGIVLYFFFGQNTRRERLVSQRSMDRLTKRSMLEYAGQGQLQLPQAHREIINLFTNLNLALPYKDNDVEVFTNGHDFFLDLLREIGRARHHIHLGTYIIEDDALGRLVADALIDKARQGVEVRLLYDDVGCWSVRTAFFERMMREGIQVQAFMPVRFPMFTSKMNYRNHRKLCIIDGRTGYIGGMNIALRYVKGTRRQEWRDTHLRLRGGAVYGIQRAFLVDWYFMARTLITDQAYYPELSPHIRNHCIAQVVTSSPVSPWPDIMQGYMRILLEAKEYVYMESPYFLPTEPILFAMRTASQAGVDIRLMLPARSDSRIIEWAGRSYTQAALEAGVKVCFYCAGFNHSKLLVCDDSLCTCGSTNVDFRSFENNFEANVFFYDRDMALRLKKVYLDDEAECIVLDNPDIFAHRPFLARLWESLIRLLSPLL